MSAKRINVSLWTLVLVAFGLRVGYCAVTRGLGQVGEGYLEYTVTARRLLLHGTMVSPLPLDEQVGREEEHVKRSLAYARERLAL